jgi:NAD(P)H dehydrogenase (quinone)
MSKKIVVILGHPGEKSLCLALAQAYAKGAESAGAQVEFVDLRDSTIAFLADPRECDDLYPEIIAMQQKITAADHLAFVYPVWWGSAPALLKGFIDRVFTSGFAFQYEEGKAMPKRLLIGRTARILVTMDSPSWWHRFVFHGSSVTWLRHATLWFSGFKVKKTSEYCMVRKADGSKIARWLTDTEELGRRDGTG